MISNETDLVIINQDDLSITINKTHPLISSNQLNSSTLASYEGLNFVQRRCMPVPAIPVTTENVDPSVKCGCPR